MTVSQKIGRAARRFISLLMACILLCSAAPLQALADGTSYDAYIIADGKVYRYSNYYDVWAYAINMNDNTVIHMNRDWNVTSRLDVKEGVSVTLNMHGHVINRGCVNPSKPTYASDSGGSGSVFMIQENAKLTIIGSEEFDAPTEHKGKRLSNYFWYWDKQGSDVISGALITGGATDSEYGGGAFILRKKAQLTMTNVTVAGNIADAYSGSYGFGGAISLFNTESRATLNNCSLIYNYADKMGGAVAIDSTDCSFTMNGGAIAYNSSDEDGGAVAVYHGCSGSSLNLGSAEITGNHAARWGGGVYLGSTEFTINKGVISYNSAGKRGGGVYVRQEDCTLNGCAITNNEAGEMGGGVLLENDNVVYVPKLNLQGSLTIKDNTVNGSKSNLYLRKGNSVTRDAAIYGIPEIDSEIWVSAEENGVITYIADSYNDSVFHADDSGKCVYWDNRNQGDTAYYRHLRIEDGSRPTDATIRLPVTTLEAAAVSNAVPAAADGQPRLPKSAYSYNGYTVYKGYGMQDDHTEANVYYYSDGYFMGDPAKYNEHLASLSLRMAAAAFNSADFSDTKGNDRDYTLQGNHIKQLLSDIGVADENLFLSPSYFVKPTADSIACAIGSKPLLGTDGSSDSGYVLIPIAVRGAGYESEWASNLSLGAEDGKEHQGFADAADKVLAMLNSYMNEHGLQDQANAGKVRFWIAGFSRAGATSNLLAKRLIDTYGDSAVFAYPFEAPQGGVKSAMRSDRKYTGIHNVLLAGDLVPHVGMISMNFQRYGVDHFLPGTAVGTATVDTTRIEIGDATQYTRQRSGSLARTIQVKDGKIQGDINAYSNETFFLKDNDYYGVGTYSYNEQKKIMLRQLAATKDGFVFDDYFHLATLTLEGIYAKSWMKEVGSSRVTLADWLPDMAFYLNYWLIGGDRLQTESARSAYVNTNTQSALRDLAVDAFTNRLQPGKIKDKVLRIENVARVGMWLGSCITEMASEVVPDFIHYSYSFYEVLADTGIFDDDCIPLSRDEAVAAIKMLLYLLWGDLTKVPNYPTATLESYGTDDYLIVFGTLLYNVNRIILNHMPDVVFSWLRSYDSFYTDNRDGVSDQSYVVNTARDADVQKPYLTMKVNGAEVRLEAGQSCQLPDDGSGTQPRVTDIRLHMADENAGGMVFYTTAGAGTAYKDYKYFDGANPFADVTDWTTPQSITAHTVWYDTPSANATFTIYFTRNPNLHKVYVNGEQFGGVWAPGATGSIPIAAPDDYHAYQGWGFDSSKMDPNKNTPVVTLSPDPLAPETLTFTMPSNLTQDVYFIINYPQKKVREPVSSPQDGTYAYDQLVTFSTPSGTAEDGFELHYEYQARYKLPFDPWQTADSDKLQIFSLGNEGTTVWEVNVWATHEGWLDSDTRKFIYTIDPTQREYTVEVLDGTLDSGETTGRFRPGARVTVKTTLPSGPYWMSGWKTDPAGLIPETVTDLTVTFTMPNSDVTVEPVFGADDYLHLSVTRGTAYKNGSSEPNPRTAHMGDSIRVVADAPQTDKDGNPTERFEKWAAEGITLKHDDVSEFTFRMPNNDVSLEAVFVPLYTLSVVNGTAYDEQWENIIRAAEGDKVTIVADEGASLKSFTRWSFEPAVTGIDVTQRELTFTMPKGNLTVTALYKDVTYNVTVIGGYLTNTGKSQGSFAPGQTVSISANVPDDSVFSVWNSTPATLQIVDPTARDASFTMPEDSVTVEAVFVKKPPQTGDRAHPFLWASGLLLSAAAFTLFIFCRRGRKRA